MGARRSDAHMCGESMCADTVSETLSHTLFFVWCSYEASTRNRCRQKADVNTGSHTAYTLYKHSGVTTWAVRSAAYFCGHMS